MSPVSSPLESRTLAILGALFILAFFLFFSYSGLTSYFTFDDGTTVVAVLRFFEGSFWGDLLHVLTVFTAAFRPMTTMFWRPLYAVFGFNPLPYRIVFHLVLTVNIGVAYLLARRLEMTREGAALTALFFCYNASTGALYYDTCLVGDILCFLFYALSLILYIGGRQTGNPLSWHRTAAVAATYFLALDSKELAVTLPGVLFIYEVLYRRRDFSDRRKLLRVGGLIAAMLLIAVIYLKVKVADMSANPDYHPHADVVFMVKNIGFYLQQLLYFPENSVTPIKASLIIGGLIAAGALLRSRPAVFGILYFVAALIPITVIFARTGYAAYLPYFGLAASIGAILSTARPHLSRLTKSHNHDTAMAVVLFVCVAVLLGWAHMVRRMEANAYFEWDKPKLVAFMDDFRATIPELPPNARVLMKDNVWDPDWGPMFLLRMMYHDSTIWVDRPNNLPHPPDLASYDLVVSYQAPDIQMMPVRFHHHPMNWEIRGKASAGTGMFEASSPNAHGVPIVSFSPQTIRSDERTTVTIPGLANVEVNVMYRIVSAAQSTPQLVTNWCMLDAKGSCTIYPPSAAAQDNIFVDWIQPADRRWILTRGVLSIVK